MTAITLNLSERETEVLYALSNEQELNHTQLMRQALRLYQHIHEKRKKGQEMAFVDADGNVVKQVIVGLGEIE